VAPQNGLPMPNIRARLFGGLELEDANGEPLTVNGRKTRALLGFLVVEADRWHQRDRLTGLLWADRAETQARNSLNQALYEIRKLETAAGVILIERETDRVRLVGTEIDTDLSEFQASLKADKSQAATKHVGNLLRGLESTGSDFDNWLTTKRQQFRTLLDSALTDLVSMAINGGDAGAGIAGARRLIELDPLDETATRSLMVLLARTGKRAEAIRTYRACAKNLQEELGIEPDPATQSVLEEIQSEVQPSTKPRQSADTMNLKDGHGATTAQPEQKSDDRGTPPKVSRLNQTIAFCQTIDRVTLAYATLGQGSPVVFVQSWLTHLELDWDLPVRRHQYEVLGRNHLVVRFDARGSGLSDPAPSEMTFETSVNDLATVIDALALDKVALVGSSQGAATAAAYAARNPERVHRLVLYGGYARGRRMRGSESQIAESEAFITLIREGWGQNIDSYVRMFGSFFMPDANEEQMAAFTEFQRRATSPENAVRIRTAMDNIDITDELKNVRAPTLVCHVREDAISPFEEGRRLAAAIPGARFVLLEGRNHAMLSQDVGLKRYLTEIEDFLHD
jgi:DNA-binding SARP family transcriptional activator/pimeloyl-ACP methyl ester carboxylesterase